MSGADWYPRERPASTQPHARHVPARPAFYPASPSAATPHPSRPGAAAQHATSPAPPAKAQSQKPTFHTRHEAEAYLSRATRGVWTISRAGADDAFMAYAIAIPAPDAGVLIHPDHETVARLMATHERLVCGAVVSIGLRVFLDE